MVAVKIIAAILGFIAGVLVYPWFNAYVLAFIAVVGAIAVGILVYIVVVKLLGEAVGSL